MYIPLNDILQPKGGSNTCMLPDSQIKSAVSLQSYLMNNVFTKLFLFSFNQAQWTLQKLFMAFVCSKRRLLKLLKDELPGNG